MASLRSTSASSAAVTAPFTVTLPTGWQAGDLVVIAVFGGYSSVAGWVTTPSGWTAPKPVATTGTTGSAAVRMYYRIMQAGDHNPVFTIPGTSTSFWWAAECWTGVPATAPYLNAASAHDTGSGTATFTAINPGAGNTPIYVGCAYDTTQNVTAPSPWTTRLTPTPQGVVTDYTPAAGTSSPTSVASAISGSLAAMVLAFSGEVAPDAPTLNSPATGSTVDRTSAQTFTWTFSDPNPGDSQSKFDLRYSSDGGTTWTTVTVTTSVQSWTAAANLFLNNTAYQWQVRTYDQSSQVGPYSASSFFTTGTPPSAPSITYPAAGGTVQQIDSVTWTATTQQAYQVRRVKDNAGTPDTSTVYSDTGQVNDTTSRTVSLSFPVNGRAEHVQVRIMAGSLWSAWADVLVNVAFSGPPTPGVLLTTVDGTVAPDVPRIIVAITNPTPSGSTPAAVSNDIYRSEDGGATSTRVATGVALNGTWTDYTVASATDYSYDVFAVAVNGFTTDSGWVGVSTPLDSDTYGFGY